MKNLILIDHCLSDFFSGHHLPVIQIPVYQNMTMKDVKEAIESEIQVAYEMYIPYGEDVLKDVVERFITANNPDEIYIELEEPVKEEEEPTYLFFVIGEIEHKMGFNYVVNNDITQ